MQEICRFDRDLEVATEIFQGKAALTGAQGWVLRGRHNGVLIGACRPPRSPVDITIVTATNVGRRIFIAFFEDLSCKIGKKRRSETHRTSSQQFATPVALRGPRRSNCEALPRNVLVFFSADLPF